MCRGAIVLRSCDTLSSGRTWWLPMRMSSRAADIAASCARDPGSVNVAGQSWMTIGMAFAPCFTLGWGHVGASGRRNGSQ
jgi:hypothetical protein